MTKLKKELNCTLILFRECYFLKLVGDSFIRYSLLRLMSVQLFLYQGEIKQSTHHAELPTAEF